MVYDYGLWCERHSECVSILRRFYELNKTVESDKASVKCNSILCVMNYAMQDIHAHLKDNKKSSAELCFLIRNVDVIISGMLDINNLVLGVGLRKQNNAIEKCFTDKKAITEFRTLRSQVLAHPVDTNYLNDRGESEIVYLEDVRPYNPEFDGFLLKEECDYVKQMCKLESNESYLVPLRIDTDIIPAINTIIDSLELLKNNVNQRVAISEKMLADSNMIIDSSSMRDYILSLDMELERRYPAAVENVSLSNGETMRYSIVHDCLMYFEAKYVEKTQKKFDTFLEYIKAELHNIERDLQHMKFNEDNYLGLTYSSDFAANLSYEKSKMQYLKRSNQKSYIDGQINNDTPSDALWGIRCFRKLIPYIEKHIPVDTSVSDKELYCLYEAAMFFYNTDREKTNETQASKNN